MRWKILVYLMVALLHVVTAEGCKPLPKPTGIANSAASDATANCVPNTPTSQTNQSAPGTSATASSTPQTAEQVAANPGAKDSKATTKADSTATSAEKSTAAGKDSETSETFTVALTGDSPTSTLNESNDSTWKNHIGKLVKENCATCHDTGKQEPVVNDYSSARAVALKVAKDLIFGKHPRDKILDVDIDHLKSWAEEIVKGTISGGTNTGKAAESPTEPPKDKADTSTANTKIEPGPGVQDGLIAPAASPNSASNTGQNGQVQQAQPCR